MSTRKCVQRGCHEYMGTSCISWDMPTELSLSWHKGFSDSYTIQEGTAWRPLLEATLWGTSCGSNSFGLFFYGPNTRCCMDIMECLCVSSAASVGVQVENYTYRLSHEGNLPWSWVFCDLLATFSACFVHEWPDLPLVGTRNVEYHDKGCYLCALYFLENFHKGLHGLAWEM